MGVTRGLEAGFVAQEHRRRTDEKRHTDGAFLQAGNLLPRPTASELAGRLLRTLRLRSTPAGVCLKDAHQRRREKPRGMISPLSRRRRGQPSPASSPISPSSLRPQSNPPPSPSRSSRRSGRRRSSGRTAARRTPTSPIARSSLPDGRADRAPREPSAGRCRFPARSFVVRMRRQWSRLKPGDRRCA